jgi:NAD(P)H-quinone oxidoreductase subunit 4
VLEFAVSPPFDPTSPLTPELIEAGVPWLSLSILFPIVGALIVPFIPDQGEGKQVRWFALGVALITFLITGAAYLNGYDPSVSGLQLSERVSWLPDLGLTWAVGADGFRCP